MLSRSVLRVFIGPFIYPLACLRIYWSFRGGLDRIDEIFQKESDPFTTNEGMLEVINTIRFRHFDKAVEVSHSLRIGICYDFQVIECVDVLIYGHGHGFYCSKALRQRGKRRVMIDIFFVL